MACQYNQAETHKLSSAERFWNIPLGRVVRELVSRSLLEQEQIEQKRKDGGRMLGS